MNQMAYEEFFYRISILVKSFENSMNQWIQCPEISKFSRLSEPRTTFETPILG
jgi:hypothetical protein